MGSFILAGEGAVTVERRATPRFDLALSVKISIWAGGDVLTGMSTDISESGAQVLIPWTQIPDRTVLELECSQFAATAEVAWSRRDGDQARLGLKFVTLSNRDRAAIQSLVGNLMAGIPPTIK